ncbi:MAG TPA: PadR family transcriptional regulator [Aggregatilineales bacterium]|nr:PadR family transcriptional regulator [Aggregatilineales bacterium]
MHRRLLLLGLLRREDMHGYRLNEFVEREMAFCADVKKPTAYYLLDKLAEEGYLSEKQEPFSEGRPPRKTYSITPEGELYFRRLLRENLRQFEPPTFPVDMSVAFLEELPPAEALELLHERQRLVEERLVRLRETPEHEGALQFVIDHHIRHFEAELDWLHEITGWLETRQPDSEGKRE